MGSRGHGTSLSLRPTGAVQQQPLARTTTCWNIPLCRAVKYSGVSLVAISQNRAHELINMGYKEILAPDLTPQVIIEPDVSQLCGYSVLKKAFPISIQNVKSCWFFSRFIAQPDTLESSLFIWMILLLTFLVYYHGFEFHSHVCVGLEYICILSIFSSPCPFVSTVVDVKTVLRGRLPTWRLVSQSAILSKSTRMGKSWPWTAWVWTSTRTRSPLSSDTTALAKPPPCKWRHLSSATLGWGRNLPLCTAS